MRLVVLGYGYTAAAFVRRMRPRLAGIVATVRSPAKAAGLEAEGIAARLLDDEVFDPRLPADLAAADAVLVSIPPGESGDVVPARLGPHLAASPARWIGYLSTIGVYGDHGGAWIDEAADLRPTSARARRRVAAERAWLDLGAGTGRTVAVFRLAGIYGPCRSPLAKLREGRATRINKPGQVFNRIHVDDIATVLEASLARPRAGAVYDVADGEPAPPQEVVAYGAALLGIEPPPEVPFAEAELSPMARSFYGENKRVRAALIRTELGVALAYPSYREGLAALAREF